MNNSPGGPPSNVAGAGGLTGEDLDARGGHVGLADTQGLAGAAAGAEGGHDVALRTRLRAAREGGRDASVAGQEGHDQQAPVVFEVDRGQPMVVGEYPFVGVCVVEDYAAAATGEDVEALFDTPGNAALADHDLTVERARGERMVPATAPHNSCPAGRQNDRRRRADAAGDARASHLEACRHCSPERGGGGECAVGGARGDSSHPRPAVIGGVRGGAGVACRRGDEDARVVGIQEGQLDRIGVGVVATADREVDDVDAILNRLLDRRDGIALEAALVAADLVDHDVRARRDARDDPARNVEDVGRDLAVAAEVVAVCVPWPLSSRAVVNSVGSSPTTAS